MVGMVVTISPNFSLYRMVVLPAASNPTIKMRICFLPKRREKREEMVRPMAVMALAMGRSRRGLGRPRAFSFHAPGKVRGRRGAKAERARQGQLASRRVGRSPGTEISGARTCSTTGGAAPALALKWQMSSLCVHSANQEPTKCQVLLLLTVGSTTAHVLSLSHRQMLGSTQAGRAEQNEHLSES